MGREIEIKIPLTDDQYDKIFSVITGAESLSGLEVLGQPGHLLKSDIYFSRYNTREESKAAGEPQVIRIRSEAGAEKKAFFCIKTHIQIFYIIFLIIVIFQASFLFIIHFNF